VIFVHGAGGTHTHWGYQLRDLAASRRVIALDLPGHGRSALPGRDSIGGYRTALIAFLDALGLDRAVLVGHSMGGAVCLQTALDTPERVAGLGLAGTSGRLRVLPAILEGLANDRSRAIRLIVEHSYADGAPEELLQRAYAGYAACDPATLYGDFVACDRFDVIDRLAQIGCPTAIVTGSEDRMTPPKRVEALRERIPGSTLTLIPHAGHMAMIEQPGALTAALLELLARC
jgi:pimeloyl-ACP methyl ester carboxylesterase